MGESHAVGVAARGLSQGRDPGGFAAAGLDVEGAAAVRGTLDGDTGCGDLAGPGVRVRGDAVGVRGDVLAGLVLQEDPGAVAVHRRQGSHNGGAAAVERRVKDAPGVRRYVSHLQPTDRLVDNACLFG